MSSFVSVGGSDSSGPVGFHLKHPVTLLAELNATMGQLRKSIRDQVGPAYSSGRFLFNNSEMPENLRIKDLVECHTQSGQVQVI